MRALRVVGYDEQGVVILEDPDRRERFTVPADERLRAAARGDVQRLGQMSTELESQLRPREIQARIRAGASVEQVAAAAGVQQQRIERFAYPVLLERSRIAELARDAHPVRDDGPDVRTLSEIVSHTFVLRGQQYEQAEWDAWRGEDRKWVVTLSWKVGRSDITARWGYQPGSHGGTVSALDEHATDLLDGHLTRPPRRVGPVIDFSKPDVDRDDEQSEQTPTPAPKATPTTTAGTARATDTERPAVARVSGIDRGAARATDAGRRAIKTTTGPSATGARSSASATTPPAEARPAAATPAAPARPAPAPADAARPDAADESAAPKRPSGRKAKPVMPSWEDVLLGVKSQRN
jgi:hypothetical protein